MKTILKCKWAVSLCLATLLMAACSTEETNVPPLAENESSKLISALEIVNQELMILLKSKREVGDKEMVMIPMWIKSWNCLKMYWSNILKNLKMWLL